MLIGHAVIDSQMRIMRSTISLKSSLKSVCLSETLKKHYLVIKLSGSAMKQFWAILFQFFLMIKLFSVVPGYHNTDLLLGNYKQIN